MKYSDLQTIPKRFRIWDMFHKRWFQGGTSDQDRTLGVDAVHLFGETAVFGTLFHDQNCIHDSDDWEGMGVIDMLEHLVCVQSTGLKDKNGREIFEGDIIKFGEVVAVVEYHYGVIQYYRVDKQYYLLAESRETEIIGNIFENPELLGEQVDVG